MALSSQTLRLAARSDLVLSARHGTEGGHACLDYIPGSAILGATVAAWLRAGKPFDPALFLSGVLRFHNAYPAPSPGEPGPQATVPTPFAFHQPKEANGQILNGVLCSLDPKDHPDQPQLKQMRQGFIPLETEPNRPLKVAHTAHTSRMKTAIDREGYGRSKDSQLFDYQAIQADQSFLCTLEADPSVDAAVLASLVVLLCGSGIRIGRSRSAEFGSVRVEAVSPSPIPPPADHKEGTLVLYLASDLILLRHGNPVLLPIAEDFGLPKTYKLDLSRTFIRTRAYSPWIHYRDGYDIERQAITQGSVLTFEPSPDKPISAADVSASAAELCSRFASGWGLHRNEGCGRIIVNPPFLLASEKLTLATAPKVAPAATEQAKPPPSMPAPTPLTRLIGQRHEAKLLTLQAEPVAKKWADALAPMLKAVEKEVGQAPGKTQWAKVRSIASTTAAPEESLCALREFLGNARRHTMWNEPVACRVDRGQQAHRLSLAQFLLGENGGTQTPWAQSWFVNTAKSAGIPAPRHPRLWALVVALTATRVIRQANRSESAAKKEPTHV